jgi:hypothetical protein
LFGNLQIIYLCRDTIAFCQINSLSTLLGNLLQVAPHSTEYHIHPVGMQRAEEQANPTTLQTKKMMTGHSVFSDADLAFFWD